MKYLTVAEYAAAHGITEQAVYKQIRAGKLPTVEREKNGKRTKFIPEEEQADATVTAATPNAALAAALAALTEQLKAKDAQIAKLTMLLDQAQQLHAHTNKLLELAAHPEEAQTARDIPADEPPAAAPEIDPGASVPATDTTEPEAKRRFWARIFG